MGLETLSSAHVRAKRELRRTEGGAGPATGPALVYCSLVLAIYIHAKILSGWFHGIGRHWK